MSKWNGHLHWAKGDIHIFFYNQNEVPLSFFIVCVSCVCVCRLCVYICIYSTVSARGGIHIFVYNQNKARCLFRVF